MGAGAGAAEEGEEVEAGELEPEVREGCFLGLGSDCDDMTDVKSQISEGDIREKDTDLQREHIFL